MVGIKLRIKCRSFTGSVKVNGGLTYTLRARLSLHRCGLIENKVHFREE